MIKKLVCVALLMLGSLDAMEQLSDEQIAALFVQVVQEGCVLLKSTDQQQGEANITHISEVQKKRRESASEQPLGSQEELPIEDVRKARVLAWLQNRHLEYNDDALTILADKIAGRLLAKRESLDSSEISIGSGAGCWGSNVPDFQQKSLRLPGDWPKPPPFPSEP